MMVQSVARSFHVLEAVAELHPVGVAELSRRLELPKSTVQRSLTTLAELRWIEPAGNSFAQWSLGPKARHFAKYNGSDARLREAALIPMQSLRDETGETIHLVIPTGATDVMIVERMDSTQAVRTFVELGEQAPIYTQSSGLAMLAHMPKSRVDAIVTSGIKSFSKTGLRNEAELNDRLSEVRDTGYAVNLSMYRPDVCAIGVAIFDADGSVVAGLAISMPQSRYRETEVPRLAELAQVAARDTGNRLSAL